MYSHFTRNIGSVNKIMDTSNSLKHHDVFLTNYYVTICFVCQLFDFQTQFFGGTLDPKLPGGWTTHLKKYAHQIGNHFPTDPGWKYQNIYSPSLTWNLKMMISKRNLLFQGAIFRFHVKLWEGIWSCHHLESPKFPHFPNWVGQNPSNSLSCISGAKNFKDKPLASTAAEESLDRSEFCGRWCCFFMIHLRSGNFHWGCGICTFFLDQW